MTEDDGNSSRDIAVIGGGIAAMAAILRLRAGGADPLWIAPRADGGDIPGEHLSPAARPLLAEIGAAHLLEDARHREAQSVFSAWGSPHLAERAGIVHLEGPGLVLDRAAFEEGLRGLTGAQGVAPVEAKLDRLSRGKDGLWRLGTSDGASYRSRFILDGSGRAAVVAGLMAGDHAGRFRADRLIALCAFLPQAPDAEVMPTRATLLETMPEGWWYATLLGDGRLAVNFYTDPDLLPREATKDTEVLDRLLGASSFVGRWVMEADFQLTQPPALRSAGTTWLAPATGEGWAAIGDAAAAFDPLSSHGMTTALWSGIRAADAARALFDGDKAPLASYAAAVAHGVQDFLESRAAVYGEERRFADAPFWRRRLVGIEAATQVRRAVAG